MSAQEDCRSMLGLSAFDAILSQMEQSAVNQIVSARADDDAARMKQACMIAAIRDFRRSVQSIADGPPAPKQKQVVA